MISISMGSRPFRLELLHTAVKEHLHLSEELVAVLSALEDAAQSSKVAPHDAVTADQ